MTVRRLTVCFTGDDAAKAAYDALIPDGGTYRAFRDRVFGAGDYREDVAEYAPEPAGAYHRFLAFHWANAERGGPPKAAEWTPEEADRLRRLMRLLHGRGFRARFYCLDGRARLVSLTYRFPDEAAARLRWKAAAEAGVDWVATDDYAEIVEALGR